MPAKDLDDAYHEYLWGESSPRSFARNAKHVGTTRKGSRNVITVVTADFDAADLVPR